MSLLEMVSNRPGGSDSVFETYKHLDELEKHICRRLVKGAGPLGWSEAILVRNAHIKLEDIRPLVNRGLVLVRPRWEWAQLFVGLEGNIERFEGMELGGGEDAGERDLYFLYERAREMVMNK